MVEFNNVQAQLMRLPHHSRTSGLCIQEVKKLAHVLEAEERIVTCLKAWHKGTMSLICATSSRLIILSTNDDSKPIHAVGYDEVTAMHHGNSGWFKILELHTHEHKFSFRLWRFKRADALWKMHEFIRLSAQVDSTTSRRPVTDRLFAKAAFVYPAMINRRVSTKSVNSWHKFIRKVGNAATGL